MSEEWEWRHNGDSKDYLMELGDKESFGADDEDTTLNFKIRHWSQRERIQSQNMLWDDEP